jgi:hypothetical protein
VLLFRITAVLTLTLVYSRESHGFFIDNQYSSVDDARRDSFLAWSIYPRSINRSLQQIASYVGQYGGSLSPLPLGKMAEAEYMQALGSVSSAHR